MSERLFQLSKRGVGRTSLKSLKSPVRQSGARRPPRPRRNGARLQSDWCLFRLFAPTSALFEVVDGFSLFRRPRDTNPKQYKKGTAIVVLRVVVAPRTLPVATRVNVLVKARGISRQ